MDKQAATMFFTIATVGGMILGGLLGYTAGVIIEPADEPRFAAEATAWAEINQVTPTPTETPMPDLTTAEAYLARGIEWWEDGYFEQPIADFTRAIELDPTLADAYFYRGWTYHSRDWFESPDELAHVLADYDRVIELDPEHSRAYNNRGFMFWRWEPERAIDDFVRAVEIDPNYIIAWGNLTVVYASEGESEKLAEACFALDELTVDYRTYTITNVCYVTLSLETARELKNYERIVELLTRVIAENEEQGIGVVPYPYIERGQAYVELGQYSAATDDFTRVLELFEERDEIPDDINSIVLARAQAYAANEDYADALIDYDFLIENEPDNIDYYRVRGDFYYAGEQYAEALADYRRVEELSRFPDHDLADRIAELEARIAEQGQE